MFIKSRHFFWPRTLLAGAAAPLACYSWGFFTVVTNDQSTIFGRLFSTLINACPGNGAKIWQGIESRKIKELKFYASFAQIWILKPTICPIKIFWRMWLALPIFSLFLREVNNPRITHCTATLFQLQPFFPLLPWQDKCPIMQYTLLTFNQIIQESRNLDKTSEKKYQWNWNKVKHNCCCVTTLKSFFIPPRNVGFLLLWHF